ncbi:NAD(P)-dependent oxidoreductase [Aliiroseovarius sp. F20344]|uniref:NAD-dependent epimerase/dehydratase family protein n=1 Tax=Aliiroseovarius sp. F20344 TaxID=2926414 RepID=UPI001FF43FD0|nr:NAD(P)-dependent oxidoreductase [Aliiroseovarius sp. F20344]MCK0143094.1 NAD(P)-dependent oxidoreductase [Aliiroseovarius sp. F20344]
MKRRVLISGGTGFIGSHLARALLANGDEVAVLSRPGSSTARLQDIASQIGVYWVDSQDLVGLTRQMQQIVPDVIYHLSAQTRFTSSDPLRDLKTAHEANVAPLLTMIRAADALQTPPKAFIRAGTIAEYGRAPAPHDEGSHAQPTNAYAASMLSGTHYLNAARPHLRFATTTARLALTYGPDQGGDFIVPSMVEACLSGENFDVRRPEDRRDLVHVSDMVQALIGLGRVEGDLPPVLNLGSATAPSMRELAQMVLELTGASEDLLHLHPQDPETGHELCLISDKVFDLTGWRPSLDLNAGLTLMIKAMEEQEGLSPYGRRSA